MGNLLWALAAIALILGFAGLLGFHLGLSAVGWFIAAAVLAVIAYFIGGRAGPL